MPPPRPDVWSLDQVIADLNSRKIEIDDGIRELSRSIVANGLLQPLLVLENRHLIAGFRRLAALLLAKITTANVLVYPDTLTPSQIRIINLTENVQRQDLKDPEIFLACCELMALNPDWQRKDLAAHLGKSAAMVTNYLCPDDLTPEAKQAFLEGKFGFTKAYSIVKNQNQAFALNMTLSGATRSEVDAQTKYQQSGNENAGKIKTDSIKVIVGGVTVTVKKKGDLSLDDAIKQLPEALKELERAKKAGHDAKTLAALMKKKAKASAG
jgi:ParB/RepB/Spo0J family partition protein